MAFWGLNIYPCTTMIIMLIIITLPRPSITTFPCTSNQTKLTLSGSYGDFMILEGESVENQTVMARLKTIFLTIMISFNYHLSHFSGECKFNNALARY